eukprot:GFUD01018055.1.p1 GENE.GFUD01018055.1~~GFUD01018055.1.p1  ORF type:complete len:429 (-),score=110.47 GFUD01018055.1:58-1344(-)
MAAEKDEMKKGVFNRKENLLSDISKVYREGLYSDITFLMADNVSVSTNRFMLACRVPYFATMLHGGLPVDETNNSVPLNCCDSKTFQQIMIYVWEGEISFSDLSIQSLLGLLEASRFFCLDSLVDGVVEYLQYLLDSQKVEFKDCLAALDFLILHKFVTASDLFLKFIDQNLSSISSLPEFDTVSEYSMQALLKYEKTSTEIVLFTALSKWLEKKASLPANVRMEMLSCFDLERFTKNDLMKIVRKTNFFDDKDICDVLEKHLEKLGEAVDSNKCQIDAQNKQIEAMQGHIEAQQTQIKESEEELKAQKKQIKEREAIKLSLNQGYWGSGSRFEYLFMLPSKHLINTIEFKFDNSNFCYSFTVRFSLDGVTWTDLLDYKEVKHYGQQNCHFERRKMKLLAVKVTGSKNIYDGNADPKPTISGPFALMI